MQSDSVQFSATGHSKVSHQAPSLKPLVKTFVCNRCTLIFKSKVYLFEHLNNVHGLDVNAALRGAGLKYAECNKACVDNNNGSPEKLFKCRHCDFKTCDQDVFSKHKKDCKKMENSNLVGSLAIPEIPDDKVTVNSNNQQDGAAEAEEMPSALSATSTSETKCMPNSKDIKTYQRPSQTITKYFFPAPRSNDTPHRKSVDDSKINPIVNDSATSSESEDSECATPCKVTANSRIDMAPKKNDVFLQNVPLAVELTPRPQEQIIGIHNDLGKRKRKESSEGPCAKQAKSGENKTEPAGGGSLIKQPSSNTDFSFEVSEDEEEKKVNLVYGDQPVPKLYHCKHCDYSNVSFRYMSSHYRNYHPYIRYKADYIHNSKDQSATFRCLECPIEFSSAVDLRWHYMEKHPEAPDVFKMKLSELSLAFKCFQCPFITNDLKGLIQHYKERHPVHKMDNALLFLKYSVTEFQRELDEPVNCKKLPLPESSGEISVERARSALSPRGLISKGPEVALHKCNKCEFMHKSVIAMHVHYQNKHPDEEMTIAKIKQLPLVLSLPTSKMTPEKESSTDTKDNAEQLKQKKNYICAPRHVPEASRNLSTSPKALNVASVEDENKNMPATPPKETAAGADHVTSKSPKEVFYCQFCNYTSINIKAVVAHQCAKHSKNTTAIDVCMYSAKAHKQYGELMKRHDTEIKHDSANLPLTKSSLYEHPEKLFFCQMCNFANPTVKGIINHQGNKHRCIKSSSQMVLEHTELVRDQIQKAKSRGKGSSSSSNLPPPIISKGEENMFFCHLCNYRHSTVNRVASHYSKQHRVYAANGLIHKYSSMVHKKLSQKSPLNTNFIRNVNRDLLDQLDEPKPALASAPTSDASQAKRSFQCYKCSYSAPHLYLFNRHLWKAHHSNRSISDVLRMFYRQGIVQSGYHCKWCMFSHKKAEEVFQHCQKEHPTEKSTLESVRTRQYVGPDSLPTKRKKPKFIHKVDDSLGGQRSRQTDSPSEKRANAKSQVEDLDKMPGLFESFQVPLDITNEAASDRTVLQSPSCPATFKSQKNVEEKPKEQPQVRVHVFKCPYCAYVNTVYQGILTHCQMKHPTLTPRADSLHVDVAQRQGGDESMKKSENGGIAKLSGYMCESCPQIFSSGDKLNRHCKLRHNVTGTSPPKPPSVAKINPTEANRFVSKASFLSKKIYGTAKCQHCSYSCATKGGLRKHMHVEHKKVASKDCICKCVLCSKMYFSKSRLGLHYAKTHGKSAYLKYYLPIYKKGPKTSAPSEHPMNDSTDSNTILIYKCPSCSYVNASYHGTLTHCQMKHPKVIVRADKLETGEIRRANLVRCSLGRASNERGYKCEICPQVHPSLMKLKSHVQQEHGKAAVSTVPAETETKQLVECLQASSGEAESLQNKPPKASLTETTPHTQTPQEKILYECQICPYKVFLRKYLRNHYKSTHKLDTVLTYKLLEKYNMRKRNYLLQFIGNDKSGDVRCKECPDATFSNCQLLIEHYSNFHCKPDFTVISLGKKKNSTGIYSCKHCGTCLYGTRNLRRHLDRHRSRAMEMAKAALGTNSEAKSSQVKKLNEVPTFKSLVKLTEGKMTPAESITLPSSPQPSTQDADAVKSEEEDNDEGHTCKLCKRVFKSLTSLRSHERSHAALAAIKKLDSLPMFGLKHNINKYVLHEAGVQKPFLCSCCSYRTTHMGFWRSHFLKKHQDVIQRDSAEVNSEGETPQRVDVEPSDSSEKIHSSTELDEETERSEESPYSEPPDVQRQLNHYNLISQSNGKPHENTALSGGRKAGLLHCEICNFSSEHLSSIRRHYMKRHERKMVKCKDCSFFSGLQKTLEVHMKTGHSISQSGPTYEKDFGCPFCLYQTKNKNNMIDHIVLHREERLVPIQVCRPKLSRYLRGLVFRCHKCTFTTGSAEKLRVHVRKHEDIKPYKCRLCYFDCSRLCDLEEHLSNKHQVLRNHKLVGQVCLNKLEARPDVSEEEEERIDNKEDGANEEHVMDCDDGLEVKNLAEREKEGEGEHEECPAKGAASGIQKDDRTEHKQHPQTQTETEPANQPDAECENRSGAEEEQQTSRTQERKAMKGSSTTYFRVTESSHAHMRGGQILQQQAPNIVKITEDDSKQQVSSPVEDSSEHRTHKGADQERTVRMEPDIEAMSHNHSPGKGDTITLDQNPKHQTDTNSTSALSKLQNHTRAKGHFTFERHLLTLPPNVQLKLVHEGSSQGKRNWGGAPEPYGEMPVLENEHFKEKLNSAVTCKVEEETGQLERKQVREDETVVENKGSPYTDQDTHSKPSTKGVATDGTAGGPRVEKRYTCELCGRNFVNLPDMKQHVLRHGL
ncbi:zinc finger protein 462-like isoform 1-T2 [Menidia menidia]